MKFEVTSIQARAIGIPDSHGYCAVVYGDRGEAALVPAVFHDWREVGSLYGRIVETRTIPLIFDGRGKYTEEVIL